MGLLDSDTVSWDRQGPDSTSLDPFGGPMKASASGFPQSVTGDWQPRNGRAIERGDGLTVTLDAEFISEAWQGGMVGDSVTKDSVVYTCFSVNKHKPLGATSTDHASYSLTLSNRVVPL